MEAYVQMAKILLVDGDPQMRKLISEFLEHHGHEVIIAQDGAFGVSMSVIEHPDLIILDMMTPVMSGAEALGLIKSEPGMSSIPVLVCNANDEPVLKQEMLGAGVVAFIDKPLNLPELLNAVEGTLRFRPKPT